MEALTEYEVFLFRYLCMMCDNLLAYNTRIMFLATAYLCNL